MRHDYHVHSNYSDGRPMHLMAAAAADADLDAIGLADHCNLSPGEDGLEERAIMGTLLDETYERRRRGIEALETHPDVDLDVEIYDAVEIDYEPELEDRIAAFLDEAGFDYAYGSVHYLGDTGVAGERFFADASETERREFVDGYYDVVESLVRSELFEVAAHVDLVETNEALRGLTTGAHYRQLAEAFADSRTVPEVNAGHFGDWGDYTEFKPRPEMVEFLLDAGVEFTAGSDSHRAKDFDDRVPPLREFLDDRGIEPVSPLEV